MGTRRENGRRYRYNTRGHVGNHIVSSVSDSLLIVQNGYEAWEWETLSLQHTRSCVQPHSQLYQRFRKASGFKNFWKKWELGSTFLIKMTKRTVPSVLPGFWQVCIIFWCLNHWEEGTCDDDGAKVDVTNAPKCETEHGNGWRTEMMTRWRGAPGLESLLCTKWT